MQTTAQVTDVHEKLEEHSRGYKQVLRLREVTVITSQQQKVEPQFRNVTTEPEIVVTPPVLPAAPHTVQQTQVSADGLDHITAMLECVLEQRQQQFSLSSGILGPARTRKVKFPALWYLWGWWTHHLLPL